MSKRRKRERESEERKRERKETERREGRENGRYGVRRERKTK